MVRSFIALSLLALLAACGSSKPLIEGGQQLQRDQFNVTMLVLNMRDAYNDPEAVTPTGVPWRERFTRVANWVAQTAEPPDVILVQELNAYVCNEARQYEIADFFIEQIRQRRGIQYRIAYLLSGEAASPSASSPIGAGYLSLCPARSGNAALYRADRLRNTETRAGEPFNTEGRTDSHLLNSVPCCAPRPGTERVCGLIDGAKTVTCAAPSPPAATGAAWTRRQATSGVPAKKFDAVFSRFEVVRQPGHFVHLYNVHFNYNPDRVTTTLAEASINGLVSDMEQRFAANRLYPPIVAGDFNLGTIAINDRIVPGGAFARFDVLHWTPELMGALIGKRALFPSTFAPRILNVMELPPFGCVPGAAGMPPVPASTLTLWTDHCASIYFRLEPS
jgi:hypothetical protein